MNLRSKIIYTSIPRQIRQKGFPNKSHHHSKAHGLLERIVFLNLPANSNELLMSICNEAILIDYPLISLSDVLIKTNMNSISEFKNSDAFLYLIRNGYIELLTPHVLNNHTNDDIIHVASFSLDRFFHIFLKDYEMIKKSVIEFVLSSASDHNLEMLKSEVIAKFLKQKKLVINTILERLEHEEKISLLRSHGENWMVKNIRHGMFKNIVSHL